MLSWMMAFSTGIAVVALFPVLPPLTVLALVLLLGFPVLFYRKPFLLPYVCLCGITWGSIYGHSLLQSLLPRALEGKALWVEGTVIGLPETRIIKGRYSQSFTLTPTVPLCIEQHPERCFSALKRLKLVMFGDDHVIPGQTWRLLVKAKRPHGMSNPGGFDYQSWLILQGVGATGYVLEEGQHRLLDDNHWRVDRIRWRVAQFMDKRNSDLSNNGLLKALLIGDKRGIDTMQWDMFAATGTTHLVVISGLHVGMIGGIIYFLMRYLALLMCPSCRAERVAAVSAILAATLYALAAGFSLPTQRALVMVAVLMTGIICRRNFAPVQGIVTALTLCLMLDPLAPVSLSFWLSFAAVCCLFYGATGRRGAKTKAKWILSQYLVFIGLLPLLAVMLGRFSLLSPLANTLMVPVFSLLIVPFNLAAGLLAIVYAPLAEGLWVMLDSALGYSIQYLELLFRFGGNGVISLAAVPWTVAALAFASVLVILLPRGMPLRACGLLLLVPLLITEPTKPAAGDVKLVVLDVGQGLSVVIETAERVLVYDLGPQLGEDFDAVTAAVIPYLRYRGINKIDHLVISHGDSDHAGAWRKLLNQVEVTTISYGQALAHLPVNSQPCQRGQRWIWSGVQFEFLYPAFQFPVANSNDHSCVLKVSTQGVSFLLPGDVGQKVEKHLIKAYSTHLHSTVLIAPHHGSNSSSSWPFVKTVAPRYVVFSNGYRNQFRHPRVDIVDRYKSIDSQDYLSSESGALSFEVLEGKLLPPVEHRMTRQRFWLVE